jgi:hypothetical protein
MARRTAALALLLAAASPLRGQGKSPGVDVSRPDNVVAGTGIPTTVIHGVLTEGNRQSMLLSGWPTAIHARLELWRKAGLFGYTLESDYDWDVIIEYSPATKAYHLRRVIGNRPVELGDDVTSIEMAEQLLSKPFSPPLSPERTGAKYFYLFKAEVSTLSVSDLEAWQRWLKGEAEPAVRGKRNPVGAFRRGLESLLSRVLGGDSQSYDSRSSIFTAG